MVSALPMNKGDDNNQYSKRAARYTVRGTLLQTGRLAISRVINMQVVSRQPASQLTEDKGICLETFISAVVTGVYDTIDS